MGKNTRAIAAQLLTNVIGERQSLTTTLNVLPKLIADQREQNFIRELCFGVMRWHIRLSAIAAQLLKKPWQKKDHDLAALVLIGLYQLIYLRTPTHAAVAETVAATMPLNKAWAKGLVNALLREFIRQEQALTLTIDQESFRRYSHPRWLCKLIMQHWPNEATAILQANNQIAPLTLRINLAKITRDDYFSLLAAANIAAKKTIFSEAGIVLAQHVMVSELPGYQQGWFVVQDQAAQFSASLLELQSGMRVLDACAAPGGKTTAILTACPQLAEVVALDHDAERLTKVTENLQRLQLTATVKTGDASNLAWWDNKLFDRILLDAPCSATGVIRRHPDIKFLRQKEDLLKLTQLQQKILTNLWQTLKPGGLLVYATCSILPLENADNILHFLQSHPDAHHQIINADWGQPVAYGRQVLTGDNEMDGFYYCCLRKLYK